jgi:hypothetical protein
MMELKKCQFCNTYYNYFDDIYCCPSCDCQLVPVETIAKQKKNDAAKDAEIERLQGVVMAFGMLATLKPDEPMDINHAFDMAKRIVEYVYAERAEIVALKSRLERAEAALNKITRVESWTSGVKECKKLAAEYSEGVKE